MRRSIPLIAAAWLLLSGVRPAVAQDPEKGPFYHVEGLTITDGKPQLRLTKVTLDYLFGLESGRRTRNYVAKATLVPDPATGGEIKIGPVRRLEDDTIGVRTRAVPVRGADLWLQVQWQPGAISTVTLHDLKGPQHLTSFFSRGTESRNSACAVTRSGRNMLIAGPKGVALWDVAKRRVIENDTGPLAELRRLLATKRGNVGQWWLTDDLRYVVVEPSSYVEVKGGLHSNDTMPLTFGDTTVDVEISGLIYDRKTHQFSTFPAALDRKGGTDRVAEAEVVEGKLTLIYVNELIFGVTATIADDSGRPRASHKVETETTSTQYLGWDPAGDRLWFHVRNTTTRHVTADPNADNFLVEWQAAKDQSRSYRLTPAQIRAAIEATH